MKLFKIIAVLISLVLITGAGLALDGLRLPLVHRDTLSLELDAKPEKVWALLTGYEAQAQWWSHLKTVSLGKGDNGEDVTFTVNRHDQAVAYVTQAEIKGKKLVRAIYDPDQELPFSEIRTFELAPAPKSKGAKTLLTFHADETVKNPLFRSLAQRLKWERKNMEGFVQALQAEIEVQNKK